MATRWDRTNLGALLAMLAAPATLQAVSPRPAEAAVSTAIHIADSSYDSSSSKTVTAQCPSGTAVLGGGASIYNGRGRVTLASLRPVGSTGEYTASAIEKSDGGDYTGSWSVRSYAVCGAGLSNLSYVSADGAADAGGHAVAEVACPAGTVVVGTGATVTSADEVSLEWIRPMPLNANGHATLRVDAHEDIGGPRGAFGVGAHAVCADAPAGYEFRAVGLFASQLDFQQVRAWCPAGKVLLGGGVTSYDNLGVGHLDAAYPDPQGFFRTTSRTGVLGSAGTDWAIAAWAICALAP